MDENADMIANEVLQVVPAVMGIIRSEMRKRRRPDLSVMQFRTLVYLSLNPGACLSMLAEHLGLSMPTVSQMVDGLVEQSIVARRESLADRRKVVLSLTSQGQDQLEASLKGTRARLAASLSQLPAEDIAAVHQSMLLLESLFCQPRPVKPAG